MKRILYDASVVAVDTFYKLQEQERERFGEEPLAMLAPDTLPANQEENDE